MTNLIAVASTGPGTSGASLVDSFQGLHQSIEGGSWVDQALAGDIPLERTLIHPVSAGGQILHDPEEDPETQDDLGPPARDRREGRPEIDLSAEHISP